MADGFRLLRELGRGGMGVVYEAEELASGRSVALKVLAAGDLDLTDEAFERFRRETRIAASISDSRCVFVYGAHQVEGSPAIAMELCPGETLEHRLAKNERIPIETAVRWTLEILDGLEAAHAVGIVHRDVKPSNCFITREGQVKVGDFGLSRSLEGDVRLTQSGAFLGSPLYASPEQIRGREVGLESDIYSCGATLYALLTGRPPYHGQNIGEVLARILSEPPPPPRSLRAEIPAGLEKVVLRAMDKDPARRFREHASFRAALSPFLSSDSVAASPTRRFAAYAIDRLLVTGLGSATVFACAALGLDWAKYDPATGQLASTSTILVVSTILILVLYFALFEGLLGSTPAKWGLGLRVVAARTQQPSFARAVLRSVVLFGPTTAWEVTMNATALDHLVRAVLVPSVGIGLRLVYLSSMRRRNGYRGLHELASGTRTVQVASPFARLKEQRPVPAHALQPAGEWPRELGPYAIEGAIGPRPSGFVLQALDRDLHRKVWIHCNRAGERVSSDERRSLARPARLRWLARIDQGEASYEIFEAPGGTSLRDFLGQGVHCEWPSAHRLLSGLAEELAQLEGTAPPARWCVEQVWVDRTRNVRLLDEPLGAGPFATKAPLELLAETAGLLFAGGDGRASRSAELPLSAEPAIAALTGRRAPFPDVRQASGALAELAGRPMRVSATTRALQMTTAAIVPCLMLLVFTAIFFVLGSGAMVEHKERMRLIRAVAAQEVGEPPSAGMDEEDRRAREVLIVGDSEDDRSRVFMMNEEPHEQDIFRRALAAHPRPTAEEIAWARERTQQRPIPSEEPRERGQEANEQGPGVPGFLAVTMVIWGVASSLLALLFGGGLTFKLFGLGVRTSRGAVASRWRCLWRSAIAWVPLAIAYAGAAELSNNGIVAAGYTLAVVAAAHAFCVGYALAHPARGLQDRLARTRLVPR